MTKRVWKSGPPPHVGWWNASIAFDLRAWRWWDGKNWSLAAYEYASAKNAGKRAKGKSSYYKEIKWTDKYPENARVPRIDPSK